MQDDNISPQIFILQIVEEFQRVLRESFYGAEQAGAFLDPGPNGLLPVLRKLSAQDASTPVAGASIACHALHVAFSLDAFTDWIGGVRDITYDWEQSWRKSEVRAEEWVFLLERLESQYQRLGDAIAANASRDVKACWGMAGVLAHTAFHLGAIQVKVDELGKEVESI